MEIKHSQLTQTPLALTIDLEMDHTFAIEFGKVIDGKTEDEYMYLDEHFAYVLDEPFGDMVGFVVDDLSTFDPTACEASWQGPEFVVAGLPKGKATAGALIDCALQVFPDRSTLNAEAFHAAVGTEGEEGVDAWLACLATGEMKAHFGLGYTLWELGRFEQAYAHLRHYTELTPRNSWAWCWFGKACVSLDRMDEARGAFEVAIACERLGNYETDAAEYLAAMAE